MTNRLLLVEPSATMRYVLDKHAQSLGYAVDATESYAQAASALENQYQQFGAEYSGLLFGWPTAPQDDANRLASSLEQSAYKDFPVVVMSTDMRAETRAWVAERENSAILSWKEYQGVEALLKQLIEVNADDTVAVPVELDNSDIHLLVVDDSATIRYSLRDLFQMQGYQVSLASTEVEALEIATTSSVDIAVLDYYLTETTGDLLCRDLLSTAAVGDIICTVLTGTYSDHIIKRSLRAGAVECMFKNESSELLLNRIEAISRFVRQRRGLEQGRRVLEEIVDEVAGAVLIIEANQQISYINETGLDELQLNNSLSIVGQPSGNLLGPDGLQPSGSVQHSTTWTLPDGQTMGIDYEHIRIDSSNRSLIRFARARIPIAVDESVAENARSRYRVSNEGVQRVLGSSSESFIEQMQWYLTHSSSLSDRTSLMVMDVHVRDAHAELHVVNEFPELMQRVERVMYGIYKRPAHVALLAPNRFAFLLRHREEAQVYLLVRKIMQLCIGLEHDNTDLTLTCAGSLLSLADKQGHSLETLLLHAYKGVDLVKARGLDQILLMDLRRMLNAYPTKEKRVSQ